LDKVAAAQTGSRPKGRLLVFLVEGIYHSVRGIIQIGHHKFFWKEDMSEGKIRVLVAKPGLDGHDRGAKVVARALRDAGMEVIYTGLRQTPEMIAEAALQEDVDAVGLSILSGAHMALLPRVLELLRTNGQEHVKVFLGGIIPDEDIPVLKEMGVVGVYGPGTLTDDIIRDVRQAVSGEAVA
jgi:methylmalonyl-CoA mutase C-terminal domain/subunit